MHRTSIASLPFVGMSHQFIGADHDSPVSSYFVNAPPGRSPPLHRHPYDKIVFVQEGRGRWTINGEHHDVGPGDILVIKAGEIHTFVNTGESPLRQLDVHLSPRFIQENLG
ncbi:MAG TPA: cupin domain-containing protein [Gemmatimonadales bacterium]|nr:cupin domain-containing protein [Gemmatimonadales bacterium]